MTFKCSELVALEGLGRLNEGDWSDPIKRLDYFRMITDEQGYAAQVGMSESARAEAVRAFQRAIPHEDSDADTWNRLTAHFGAGGGGGRAPGLSRYDTVGSFVPRDQTLQNGGTWQGASFPPLAKSLPQSERGRALTWAPHLAAPPLRAVNGKNR
jgi:hypothetical protein